MTRPSRAAEATGARVKARAAVPPQSLARQNGTGREAVSGAEPSEPELQRAVRNARRVDGATARVTLATQLREAWQRAGQPSMADIGDQVGYSKASISKVLSGKQAPNWRLVTKLGIVLGVPEVTVTGRWHALWIAAAENHRRASVDAEPTGHTCDRCGSVVAQPEVHARWHTEMVPEPYRWASLRDALGPRKR